MPAIPIVIDSAINPEAACASVAPTAVSPLRITAKDEAKPTKAVMIPATIGWVAEDGFMRLPFRFGLCVETIFPGVESRARSAVTPV